jgi:hypothetical protein
MRDDADEINRRARETLARLEARDRERALERWQRGPVGDLVEREDALQRWERLRLQSVEPPKRAPPPPKQRIEMMTETRVQAMAEACIQKRLEDFAALMGEEVALVEKKMRRDFTAELDALRAEIAQLRRELDSGVIELPGPPKDWRDATTH